MRRGTLDENLAQIQDLLDQMGAEVTSAFGKASRALLDGRERLAEQVIARDPAIDGLRSRTEILAVETMNIHSPVVGPLRSVVAAIRCAHQLERMGDLAAHIAEIARRRSPDAVPGVLRPLFGGYGALVGAIGDKAVTVLRTRNVVLATELAADDEQVNALHRRVFEVVFGDGWTEGIPAAVDAALLARFHERFADQAVSMTEQVVYAVTGRRRSDALSF